VKRLQLAAVTTVTILISGCSRVTAVSERRDYKSPGGKSIEMTESWALPGFLKSFWSFCAVLFENLTYQHGGEGFLTALGVVGCASVVLLCIAAIFE
jgi:uncharacterized protein YceK